MPWPYAVTIRNDTHQLLEAYPVVVDPPPPHREHVPKHDVAAKEEKQVDPNGFNLVYFAPAVRNPERPNGLFIGFGLQDTPRLIQYKILRYVLPPGQGGQDPALAPQVLEEDTVEVTWQADTLIQLDKENRVTIVQAPPEP